jgi:hypothetical protein
VDVDNLERLLDAFPATPPTGCPETPGRFVRQRTRLMLDVMVRDAVCVMPFR